MGSRCFLIRPTASRLPPKSRWQKAKRRYSNLSLTQVSSLPGTLPGAPTQVAIMSPLTLEWKGGGLLGVSPRKRNQRRGTRSQQAGVRLPCHLDSVVPHSRMTPGISGERPDPPDMLKCGNHSIRKWALEFVSDIRR